MERGLENCLEETNAKEGVIGSILADRQGLCLGVKGRASISSSGVITALAEQAAKLEPGSQNPIILLENDVSQCLIQKTDKAVLAIFKSTNCSE